MLCVHTCMHVFGSHLVQMAADAIAQERSTGANREQTGAGGLGRLESRANHLVKMSCRL